MMNVKSNRGAALLVSLIILLILSVIGLSAVKGGLLQSLMSANAQQTAMSFRGADSGGNAVNAVIQIEKISDTGFPVTVMNNGAAISRFVDANGLLDASDAYLDNTSNKVTTSTQYLGTFPTYCDFGSSISIGKGANFDCHVFRVDSTAALAGHTEAIRVWTTVRAASGTSGG